MLVVFLRLKSKSLQLLKDILIPGLPRQHSGKESACQCRRYKKHRFDPWIGKICGEGNGNPLQFLPAKSHGQRHLAGYSPWGRKESDSAELLSKHRLIYIIYMLNLKYEMNKLIYKTETDSQTQKTNSYKRGKQRGINQGFGIR